MTEKTNAIPLAANRLTRAYIDLVHASALRRLRGDADRAADITQAVMLLMVRKAQAGKLPQEKFMAGWLIKVTGYAVMQSNRAAARRARHESEAGRLLPGQSIDDQLQRDIRDALDESLLRLNAIDREVIVRRCLQDQSLAEIGQAIGMSENTVGKRIVRAIPKLRAILLRRGITAPIAAIATVLAAEVAVKSPAACAATTSIAPSVFQLAKTLSFKLTMLKLQAAALIGVGIAILSGAGIALVIKSNQVPAIAPIAIATLATPPLVWPATQPTINVSRVIDGPSDALLKELLAGLQTNQNKLHMIHVHAVDADRMFDSKTKTWGEPAITNGQAWLEAGPDRRFRAEVIKDQSRIIGKSGQPGPIKDSCYIETWDGTTTLREYRPPISVPEGETFMNRSLGARTLDGSNFSMQLVWDEVSRADANGTHQDVYCSPLDPAVLATRQLSARRVILSAGTTAMELTVNIPDPQLQQTETFWFDPQRGYALLGLRSTFTLLKQVLSERTFVIEELTETAPGIFYPSKAQMLWKNHGEFFIWEIYSATEVKANEPVDANLFTLTFTPGIDIYDFKKGIGTKRKPTTAPH